MQVEMMVGCGCIECGDLLLSIGPSFDFLCFMLGTARSSFHAVMFIFSINFLSNKFVNKTASKMARKDDCRSDLLTNSIPSMIMIVFCQALALFPTT